MKTDVKTQIGTYTAPRGRCEIVTVPALQFLMIDGHGDPNTSTAYADAVRSIYPVAYGLKFFSKNELDRDYTVMPLEALWSSDAMDAFTTARDKSRWDWTLMSMVPGWLGPEHVAEVRENAARKGRGPVVDAVRLECLDEGLCVQTLHVGAYEDETPVLEAMHHTFIPVEGLMMTGRHHEIYLSDSRRTPAEKLRTILRQPVARVTDHRGERTSFTG